MKKTLNVKQQFREAKSYLGESKKFIYSVIIIFIISAIIGFIFRENLTFIDGFLKELLDKTAGLNTIEMIFFILQNNLQSAFFSIIFGIFLGIFPIFSALSNGVVLGYVMKSSYEIAGFGIWLRLLPHGIFELPAIFIAFGVGIKLGFSILKGVEKFRKEFYKAANIFMMIIIPLLIVAAIIEGLLIGLT